YFNGEEKSRPEKAKKPTGCKSATDGGWRRSNIGLNEAGCCGLRPLLERMGKYRAQEKEQRGIVDPEQQEDEFEQRSVQFCIEGGVFVVRDEDQFCCDPKQTERQRADHGLTPLRPPTRDISVQSTDREEGH